MKKILLLLFILSFITSCGPTAFESFQDKAKKYAHGDGFISLAEFNDLQQYAIENMEEPGFEIFAGAGNPDRYKIISYLEKEKKYKVEKPYNPKSDSVNIYIENSLSITGYISNDGSAFKNAIAQVFSVSEKFKSFAPHYVNSVIIPTDLNTENIVNIDGKAFTKGNVKSSNLDEIFKNILSATKENMLSILVSDCIYSLDKGGDASQLLKRQQLLTQRTFENKLNLNKDFTILVIKLESDFSGIYFDKWDHAHNNFKQVRPFYILAMGNYEAVRYFKAKIDTTKPDGYRNFYTINSKNYSADIYHTLVIKKNNPSIFRPIDEFSDSNYVRGIEDPSVDEGTFSFTVALDLSNLPVENAYIKDIANYQITDGDYKIEKIEPFDPKLLQPRDIRIIENSGCTPTHLITFAATSKKYESLRFSMKRKTPKWVATTGIEDDTDITKISGKTFGFLHLVNGIEEAYTSHSGNIPYYEILITINN